VEAAQSTSALPKATAADSKPPPTGPKPLEPLTGFRAALEHTGLPRGVLTWKPRLPSRNWCIFWTVLGTVTYLYYDDRKQCKQIKERTIERVRHYGQEPINGSLDVVRKVKVYGARWPEDDDTDRALRYFRKYVKVCWIFAKPKGPVLSV
jgi:import inner membrane translocase subunit TIM54